MAAPNPVSLLETPSYDIPINWSLSPLICVPRNEFQPGALRTFVSTTPGIPCSSPRKSRPRSCVSLISSALIVPDRSPLCAWACSAEASTVTTSSQAADVERDRRHREALGRGQHQSLLLVGSEPRQRDPQVVRAGDQVGEHEQPLAVRHRVASHRGRGVPHRDRRAGNSALAAVNDRAANLAAQSLGVGETRRADRQGQCQESEDTSETMHVSSSR